MNKRLINIPINFFRLKFLLAILSLSLTLFIYFQIKTNPQTPFPVIKEGKYFGKISGLSGISASDESYFQIECAADSCLPELLMFEAKPRAFETTSVSWRQNNPLLFKSGDLLLRFVEDKSCQGKGVSYCGIVINLTNGQRGTWNLSSLIKENNTEEEKKLFISKTNSDLKMHKLKFLQDQYQQIKIEIDKLTEALQDAENIKNKSDSRFSSEQQKINDLKSAIDAEEKTLIALQASFDTAKSITPGGRVASLARQILAREFDLLTPAEDISGNKELIEKAKWAKEVLALKQEVDSYQ